MVMETSSPTTTPPLSILAFHFTPKSWRLVFLVGLNAAGWLPHGFLAGAGGLARVDGGNVDGDVDVGFGDILVIERDGALHVAESSTHRGNCQVAHRELRGGVRRVDLPGGSCR